MGPEFGRAFLERSNVIVESQTTTVEEISETTGRLPYPLDGDRFVGMDVPLAGSWGTEDIVFWTGTKHYQPWKDVAAFFRSET